MPVCEGVPSEYRKVKPERLKNASEFYAYRCALEALQNNIGVGESLLIILPCANPKP